MFFIVIPIYYEFITKKVCLIMRYIVFVNHETLYHVYCDATDKELNVFIMQEE